MAMAGLLQKTRLTRLTARAVSLCFLSILMDEISQSITAIAG
jgi:hypothetical protein